MSNLVLFISYRSPSYDNLKKNNCALQNGGICKYGNPTFNHCTYTNCTYKRAAYYAKSLVDSGQISSWYIMPPQAMLPPNVVMTPIDFMELLPDLSDILNRCNCFLRFCINESGDSFWTLLEMEIWRRYQSANNRIPQEYSVLSDTSGNYKMKGPFNLAKMGENGIRLYARIKVYIIPQAMSAGHFWGRYARSILIQQCHSCGCVFGVSAKAFRFLQERRLSIQCPKCNKSGFKYNTAQDKIRKYPFRYSFSGERNLISPLHPDTMIDLLLDNTKYCPKDIPLFCMSKEEFPKEEKLIILWPYYIGKSLINNIGGEPYQGILVLRYYNNEERCMEIEVKKRLE